jgi:hypothetical protein
MAYMHAAARRRHMKELHEDMVARQQAVRQ